MSHRSFVRPTNWREMISMKTDPIVAEVRKARRDILAAFDGDFSKMSRDVMNRQERSGHPVVRGALGNSKPRKVAETAAGYGGGERP